MIEYILIATIILMTGSVWGWAISAILILQIILSMAYFLYKKSIDKMHIQKSNLIMVCILLSVYIFNIIVISKLNIFSYYPLIAQIICLFLIAESIERTIFVKKYINIIFIMSAMSLLFWAMARFGIMIYPMTIDPGNGHIYRMNLFYIYRAYNGFASLEEINARNFGVFWEGGVYQAFINIALFWLIDQKNNIKFFKLKVVVFVLTIITTFSTIGYFILILNLLFYIYRWTGKLNYKKIGVMFGSILITFLILNSPAVTNKFKSDSSSYVSYTIRLNDNVSGLKVALNSPIWGLGYQSDEYYSELNSYGIIANSSGLLKTAQEYGIFTMILLTVIQCRNFSKVLSKRNLYTTLFASLIFILILSSEPLTLYEFFLLWGMKFSPDLENK